MITKEIIKSPVCDVLAAGKERGTPVIRLEERHVLTSII